MKPPPFRLERPATVDEALALLAEHGDEAKVLAGGQSLVPLLNFRLVRPAVLVDVNRVPGLDRIEGDNGRVQVGALVRQAALEASPLTRNRLPLVAEALPYVGHFVTRNRGTVGGSVAHADASAELPLALVTLGGSARLRSARGERTLAADDFFLFHYQTVLEPDELLVETQWPAARPGGGYAFEELAQRHGDYALGMAACAVCVEQGTVADARVAVGSVLDRPTALDVELAGRPVGDELAREAGAAAAAAVDPPGNLHASASYLKHLTGVLVSRAVSRALRNALGAPVSA